MSSASSAKSLSPDWVWSNISNAHLCNDRGWFTSYTPFPSRAGSMYNNTEDMEIAGVGTVALPVKKSPSARGANAHTKLILKDVIHCPTSVCNIIGMPDEFITDYDVTSQKIMKHSGENVTYFDRKSRFFQPKLSGPPVGPSLGPSAFQQDSMYMINVRWPQDEWRRWLEFKRRHGVGNNDNEGTNQGFEKTQEGVKRRKTEPTSNSGQGTAEYTAEEKEWLKKHYKDEYHFLLQHGLKIFKEEDREEGRSILRALMVEDEMDSASEEDHLHDLSREDDEEDYDPEDDLEGHMADYHFDVKSLDWIEEHYGNSMNFMQSYGLKFYDDDDCQEAQAILRSLMAED